MTRLSRAPITIGGSAMQDHRKSARWGLLLAASLVLSACSSSDDGDGDASDPIAQPGDQLAFVASATPLADAGLIERFNINAVPTSNGSYSGTGGDLRVATDGTDIYEIGRFGIDSITRYSATDTSQLRFQESVNGQGETATNPYSITFLNENKAYVTRYGANSVWIIDPSFTPGQDEFMIGELDISAYDDDAPNATGAVIVNNRLFVLMQRLSGESFDTGFRPDKVGYVAVFDTTTDMEVDTRSADSQDPLPGIALSTTNPEHIEYNADMDEIFVVGRGNIFGNANVTDDPYRGGIETIDPATFQRDLLLDDGTMDNNQGFIADAVVVSPSLGYLTTYTSFNTLSLRSFNPTTGMLNDGTIGGLQDQPISTMAVDSSNRLWVGLRQELPGFTVIDTSDNSEATPFVQTRLNPLNIVFVDVPEAAAP